MLRVTVKASAAAAKNYYKGGLARGDYYLAGDVVPAFWDGKAAELLGLHGHVERLAFYRLCDNLKPDGTPLTPRTRADRRVAYDITLDCPKSVSLIHAFGGDDRVLSAFREAVAETNRRIEADAFTRVRKDGRSEDRPTGNLVWATFFHDTTRPVAGIPDPHIHSHTVIFNATHDLVEQRFKAVQLGYIHTNAPFYEAYFNTAFASKLRALGYGIVRNGRSWEVEGIERGLIERFSHRTREILAAAKRLGITDPDELGGLGARTRDRKSSAKPWDVVREVWASRLGPADLRALETARHLGQRERAGPTPRESLEHARAECLARSALVPEKVLLEAAMRFGVGYVSLADLEAELPKLGLAVREVGGERHVGDDSRLRDEKSMLAFARETRGTMRSFFDDYVVMPKGTTPREEQVLTHLGQRRDQVILARLSPVTGDEVVRRLQAGGQEVTRFDGRALKLPGDAIRHTPMTNPVWWVDHAQHLGTTEMAELFRQADAAAIRVVLAPSPGRVSKHSPLPLLGSRAGLRTPQRAKVERWTQQQKDAAKMLADGRVGSAMKTLDETGGLREVTQETFAKDVAAEYVANSKGGQFTQVKAGSAEMASAITEAIRESLKKLKQLGRPRRFEQLQRAIWEDEDQANPRMYRKGQIVVFYKSVKGFRVGQRYEVLGLDPWGRHVLARHLPRPKGWLGVSLPAPWVEALPLNRVDAFGVFNRSEIELAKGDVIRITMQGKTLSERFGVEKLLPKRTRAKNQEFNDALGYETPDRRYRVRTGSHHRIRRFTAGGHIELENGWVLRRDYGHLEHGYCEPNRDADDFVFRAGADVKMESRNRTGPAFFTIFTCNKQSTMDEARAMEAEKASASPAMPTPVHQPSRSRGRGMDHGR